MILRYTAAMRGIVIVILSGFMLTACSDGFRIPGFGSSEKQPLPVSNAPQREQVLDVPPDGIVPVKRGDTIYTLANRYQVPPQDIIARNNLAAPYNLAGVSRLRMPGPRGHLVVPGDTIDSISARYGVEAGAIAELNALSPPYELRAGMELVIPQDFNTAALVVPSVPESTTTTTETESTTEPVATTATRSGDAVRFSESASRFTWPVDGTIIERFGNTSARGVANDGVKIAAAADTPVRASYAGEVAFVGSGLKSFGNLVLVKHADGWITAYAHLGDVWVSEGETVGRGDLIGSVGMSGRVDSPQLHFELRKAREPVDPEQHLS